MAVNIDTARLAGFFKDRFGDNATALPSEGYDVLAKRIPFDDAHKLGEKLTQPVRMAHSSGQTFAGGSTTGTMFALNAANSPLTVEATYTSQEYVLRERTSWKALRTAQSSAQAFANHYDDMVADMKNSAEFAREYSMLYGASDLGVIESVAGTGTDRVWTLTLASSSAGLWYKMQGVLLDVFDTYGGTQVNTNADVVVASADINASSGKIEVTVTGNATDLTAIAANDVLIPMGASDNMMTGIDAIATGTTYAGISQTTYPLWAPTSSAAGGAVLTFKKLMKAKKQNLLKSGAGKRVCLISHATGVDLSDGAQTLQRFVNKKGGKFEEGAESISYHTLGGGSIELIPHVLVKEGEAFILNLDKFCRIGSTDFTFDPSGKGTYFEPVAGYAGQELMGYWDQSIICKQPSSITKITGIVNS